MYKLIGLRKTYQRSLRVASRSFTLNLTARTSTHFCGCQGLCNSDPSSNFNKTQHHVVITRSIQQTRSYRTDSFEKWSAVDHKYRRKRIKKYVHLMEVKEGTAEEQRVKIKNVNKSDVEKMSETNFDLSQFLADKLKAKSQPDALGSLTNRAFSSLFERQTQETTDIIGSKETVEAAAPQILDDDVIETVLPLPGESIVVKKDSDTQSPSKAFVKKKRQNRSKKKAVAPVIKIIEEEEEDHESEIKSNDMSLGVFQPETHEAPETCAEETLPSPTSMPSSSSRKSSKQTHSEHELVLNKARLQEVAGRTLAAYFEVCLFTNQVWLPSKFLRVHRYSVEKELKKFPRLVTVKPYNEVLKMAAFKGNHTMLQEALNYMKEDGIKPDIQTYIAIYTCLGKENINDSHLKYIRKHTKEALAQGITFNNILSEGVFVNDQREYVIKAMKAYDPDYKIVLKEPQVQYSNMLLNCLNHKDQLTCPSVKDSTGRNGMFTKDAMRDMIQKQFELEQNGYLEVANIETVQKPTGENTRYAQVLEDHLKLWEKRATQLFQELLKSHSLGYLKYLPYLEILPTKEYIKIIVEEARRLAYFAENYSATRQFLYKDLGQKVYDKYKILRLKRTRALEKITTIHQDYCDDYVSLHKELDTLPLGTDAINSRQKWQWLEHSRKLEGSTVSTDHQPWTNSVIQKIGELLYGIIFQFKIDGNAITGDKNKSPQYCNAFYYVHVPYGRKLKLEVRAHPKLSELCQAVKPPILTFRASEVPMKCPPVPWYTPTMGGYLISSCPFVRLPHYAYQQLELINQTDPVQNYPCMDSLNQLASVPWKVNEQVLDIALHIFNTGGSEKLTIPLTEEAIPKPVPTHDKDKEPEMWKAENARLNARYMRLKKETYSLRCDCLYRLSLANYFRKNIFWLPQNMDFRGRVYPIPPHFNHLGSDLARSLLMFAEKRPLGPNGLDWLKIHLINLTGLMKRDSLKERLAYANEILPDILDSADKPLDGKKWWTESEEPWQTLACCMEIAAATRSPDGEKYRTGFPIHQDGSCNGLQHYAALGRDVIGAQSVNLIPEEKPEDVYSAVVTLVEQKRKKDAADGNKIAIALEGFIKRKVIKQTIMTTVYGVTRFGARLQIEKQLKAIDDFPQNQTFAASSYLTLSTFESLRSMFTSTKAIQDWLTKCARYISTIRDEKVEWITPMGLPVVQPYCLSKKRQNNVYELYTIDKYEKTDVRKQKNAFAPNFIHSLDSSHMMLTSLHCERSGVVFVSVHDCYWTHPSTVELMNKICREQFIALHSQPILEDLSQFFQNKYMYTACQLRNDGSEKDIEKHKFNKVLAAVPEKGDFDVREVLNSTYFFS